MAICGGDSTAFPLLLEIHSNMCHTPQAQTTFIHTQALPVLSASETTIINIVLTCTKVKSIFHFLQTHYSYHEGIKLKNIGRALTSRKAHARIFTAISVWIGLTIYISLRKLFDASMRRISFTKSGKGMNCSM